MPCYEPDEKEMRGYESGLRVNATHHPDDQQEIVRLTDRCSYLEASLCAVINELEARGIAADVVSQSSRHGWIDVMSFWAKHSKSDEARVAERLHRFSVDEQKIIKKLLG